MTDYYEHKFVASASSSERRGTSRPSRVERWWWRFSLIIGLLVGVISGVGWGPWLAPLFEWPLIAAAIVAGFGPALLILGVLRVAAAWHLSALAQRSHDRWMNQHQSVQRRPTDWAYPGDS
ncbi:MAG: hypothetical protein AAF493_23155 [Pseudomonadota bacterium]